MTAAELKELFPQASNDFLAENADDYELESKRHRADSKLPAPKPKRAAAQPLVQTAQGETPIVGRIAVRFTGFRTRPLDPDGFAGSCKFLLDGCRAAGLLTEDNPWEVKLETEQVKVKTRKEEKTVIRITYPS